MGCLLFIIRPIVSFFLGLVVFAGLLLTLVSGNLSSKLLDPGFYIQPLQQQDVYNRIYTEVLIDPALQETTSDLLGDIEVDPGEIVSLLQQIIPPEYLQSQVEDAIQRTVGYFNGDLEELDLYVNLGPPLANAKDVLLTYLDGRIDALPLVEFQGDPCTTEGGIQAAAQFEGFFQSLAAGRTPSSMPSLASVDPACRELLFDVVIDQSLTAGVLEQGTQAALVNSRDDLRREFLDGDSHGFLKVAARSVTAPLLDQAIQKILDDLDGQGRLDLIARIADWNDGLTEAEIRDELGQSRDAIGRFNTLGRTLSLAVFLGALVLMSLVYLPSLANMIRWPGLTMLLTGAVTFAIGKVLQSRVPEELANAVSFSASGVSDFPRSVADLSSDLLVSYGQSLLSGVTDFSLAVLIIGAVLFVASFFVFLLRPIIPGLK
jgi:hypothetical protein